MTKTAVAQRANVSLPTVNRILSGKERMPTVPNLHAIAKALGVVVRIGATIEIEEPQSADEFRRTQARGKAMKLMHMVQGTMSLEDQAVDQHTIDAMIEEATHELLKANRRLWGA